MMKEMKRIIGLLAVLALLIAIPSMALAKEKIEVQNNESRDFSYALQKQTLLVLPADLEKKLLAQANQQLKFKVDRIFFDIDDPDYAAWAIFKSKQFPYNVTSRSRMAYLLTEQDGKYIRTFWTVIQEVDPMGKNRWSDRYRFQAPMIKVPPAAYVNNFAPDKLTNKYVEGKTP